MRKIVVLLLILSVFLFGNITQTQVDKYLKISRAGQVLDFYQKRLSLAISDKLNIQNLRKDILDISKQKRFVKIYTSNFMKLDRNDYHKIMKFYKKKIGKKSINTMLNYSTESNKLEIENIQKQCKNIFNEDCFKYINIKKFDDLPKYKLILLEKIAKEFDIIKIKRMLMKTSLLAMNTVYQKKYRYSNDFITKYSTYNNQSYHEITKNITYLSFQNFTEDELLQILEYSTSKAGKKEYQLIEEGIVEYTNVFIALIMKTFYSDKISKPSD